MLQSAGESTGLCRGTAPLAAAPPGRGAGAGAGRAVGPGPPVPPAPLPASARRGSGAQLFRFPRPPALTSRLRRRLGLPRRSPLLLPGRGPTSWSRSRSWSRARAREARVGRQGGGTGRGSPSRHHVEFGTALRERANSGRVADGLLFVCLGSFSSPSLTVKKKRSSQSVRFFYFFFF